MRVLSRLSAALAVLACASACAGGVSGTPAVGTGGPALLPSTVPTSAATATTSTDAGTASTRAPVTTTDGSTAAESTVDDSSVPGSVETTGSDSTTLASGVTIEELADDIAGAQEAVNGYWVTHWSDFFDGTYEPPTVFGLYDGTVPQAPTCDGEPLEAYNAHYCIPEDYVAWDVNLLLEGADVIGDSWVFLVVAHEWGHAVQARIDPSLVPAGVELQADCLGAAAIFGAVADGTLDLEEGDERELISSLNLLADEMAWTMTDDHGDPFERVQAFTLGRNGGVQACLNAVTAPSGEGALPTG